MPEHNVRYYADLYITGTEVSIRTKKVFSDENLGELWKLLQDAEDMFRLNMGPGEGHRGWNIVAERATVIDVREYTRLQGLAEEARLQGLVVKDPRSPWTYAVEDDGMEIRSISAATFYMEFIAMEDVTALRSVFWPEPDDA
jgi:hypothetical protein